MKLAVMQPYLFPYAGYFQLIYAADIFLIYDDVSYIRRGFVNRNNILAPSGVIRFTISVPGASQNKLFSELKFSQNVGKTLRTIENSYAKAPYFEEVFPIISETLTLEDRSIASVCQKGFESVFSYIGIEKQFKKTSELDYDRSVCARDRLINLCHKFSADCYINAPGGRKLYSWQDFSKKGIDLNFVESLPFKYSQGKNNFTSGLSIIDILMNCSPNDILKILESYELSRE